MIDCLGLSTLTPFRVIYPSHRRWWRLWGQLAGASDRGFCSTGLLSLCPALFVSAGPELSSS